MTTNLIGPYSQIEIHIETCRTALGLADINAGLLIRCDIFLSIFLFFDQNISCGYSK